jgi:hypothetical protein
MKPDLYTKAVLTIIALALVPIACNQYVHPAITADAQGPFAGVQILQHNSDFSFFDSRTRDLWSYSPAQADFAGGGRTAAHWYYLGKVTQLGQSLVNAPK